MGVDDEYLRPFGRQALAWTELHEFAYVDIITGGVFNGEAAVYRRLDDVSGLLAPVVRLRLLRGATTRRTRTGRIFIVVRKYRIFCGIGERKNRINYLYLREPVIFLQLKDSV